MNGDCHSVMEIHGEAIACSKRILPPPNGIRGAPKTVAELLWQNPLSKRSATAVQGR
jgi:hypothetical protein